MNLQKNFTYSDFTFCCAHLDKRSGMILQSDKRGEAMSQTEPDNIKIFLADAIDRERKGMVDLAAEQFGVSRQTIHAHLAEMVAEGLVEAAGRTSGRIYTLKILAYGQWQYQIAQRPAEDVVWRERFAGLLSGLASNVRAICGHGFMEMFNNAVDHSGGSVITTGLERTYAQTKLYVFDDGVGIFKKVKEGLRLADEREAILELAKGKVTTAPLAHSGQGVFFTTRMFDSFSLLANKLYFSHNFSHTDDDWLIEARDSEPGTSVKMTIATASKRTTLEVFDKYSSGKDEPNFAKTHVPVKLLLVGDENLVSRSQASALSAVN